jgi:hypothetical protein
MWSCELTPDDACINPRVISPLRLLRARLTRPVCALPRFIDCTVVPGASVIYRSARTDRMGAGSRLCELTRVGRCSTHACSGQPTCGEACELPEAQRCVLSSLIDRAVVPGERGRCDHITRMCVCWPTCASGRGVVWSGELIPGGV